MKKQTKITIIVITIILIVIISFNFYSIEKDKSDINQTSIEPGVIEPRVNESKIQEVELPDEQKILVERLLTEEDPEVLKRTRLSSVDYYTRWPYLILLYYVSPTFDMDGYRATILFNSKTDEITIVEKSWNVYDTFNPVCCYDINFRNEFFAEEAGFTNCSVGRCTEQPNNSESFYGILRLGGVCSIPEGCGPKYQLLNSDMKTYTVLVGDINESHSELILQVIGKKINTTNSIGVYSYKTLSEIPYHNFLIGKGGEYTKQNYPCLSLQGGSVTLWNKEFGWEVISNETILKVRMTDVRSGEEPQPYYELWYDGNSGQFIKELKYSVEVNFCES